MIIAVWGLTGAGKNTLGKLLAEKLGFAHVCPTFKDVAKAEGVSLIEFQKMAEKDHRIDKKFDKLLKEECAGGDCVVTTWLGPWMLDADVRIKLHVPEEERARRIAGRDKMTVAQALKHVEERDENNRRRYKAVYDIDITDEDVFDACLNGRIYEPHQLLEISLKIIEQKTGKTYES
jgi:cytidylate kinase